MVKLLLGILWVGAVSCLKISHQQPQWPSRPIPVSPSTTFTPPTIPTPVYPTSTSQPPTTTFTSLSQEEKNAYSRLRNFIVSDSSLKRAMELGATLDQSQLKKLLNFFANDPFFPLKMINDSTILVGKEWLRGLSDAAKIRYAKIVYQFTPLELNDPKKAEIVVSSLLNDKQIGPAVIKRFGNNPSANIIKNLQDQNIQLSASYHDLSIEK